jgi:hypothetical protein
MYRLSAKILRLWLIACATATGAFQQLPIGLANTFVLSPSNQYFRG